MLMPIDVITTLLYNNIVINPTDDANFELHGRQNPVAMATRFDIIKKKLHPPVTR